MRIEFSLRSENCSQFVMMQRLLLRCETFAQKPGCTDLSSDLGMFTTASCCTICLISEKCSQMPHDALTFLRSANIFTDVS